MEKINVVLVVLNGKNFNQAMNTLNFETANLVAVVVENGNGKFLTVSGQKVPLVSFAAIQQLVNAGKNFIWLINGYVNNVNDIWRTKKFLTANGVPEENVVNFEIFPHISTEWIANLRYVEEHGADFFATGISYSEVGFDLRFIPHTYGRGVNLSGSNQDLQQGYLTAKYVFEHVKPGTIKFVLIGLAPYAFRYTNTEAFSVCSRNLQYMLALKNFTAETRHDKLLKTLVGNNVKKIFTETTARQADLNFIRTKTNLSREFPAQAVTTWEDQLKNLTKKLRPKVIEKNLQILKDYIKLCRDNGAKPVGVVFPFAPAMHDNYDEELLTLFRLAIRQLEETTEFTCVDMFDIKLGYDCFYDMAHLNLRGAGLVTLFLSLQLYERNLLPTENFCAMNYEYFNVLSKNLPEKTYSALMKKVFAASVAQIRRKNKVKVGFVLYDSSMWCGDDLYNFFARDERFEPTIFLCLRTDKVNDELMRKDFQHGIEQFKSHGFNVTVVAEKNFPVPVQDVLIFLTPYIRVLPNAFQLNALTPKTLTVYMPYAVQVSTFEIWKLPLLPFLWKIFFETETYQKIYRSRSEKFLAQDFYSGCPKLDEFFNADADFHFEWKTVRPDAKKIIYAPHWTINDGVNYATFQWNFRFMYEFAKAHTEISWVFKPHPNLLFAAVRDGVFPSTNAFEEYLQAWNELPNAQVVTGAYYQEIFATSDGMIHDSGSFIAEYQYTNKPMIFLTRDTQEFNETGNAILKVSYCVDGRDPDAIAALMKKVFIDGDDFMQAERQKVFDERLNYFKRNGLTASEFIFRNLSEDLRRV